MIEHLKDMYEVSGTHLFLLGALLATTMICVIVSLVENKLRAKKFRNRIKHLRIDIDNAEQLLIDRLRDLSTKGENPGKLDTTQAVDGLDKKIACINRELRTLRWALGESKVVNDY